MTQTRPFLVPDDSLVLKPTIWQRWPWLGWPLAIFLTTAVLTYVSFPPVNAGEMAFAFAIPAALWAYRQPAFRVFAWTILAAQVVAWTALLGWLHHVTWVGLFLLGPFVGLLSTPWFLAVWWTVQRLRGHRALIRISAMLALAALWVVLEWFRGWLFGGFPWLPLAASQWQRPAMLQVAAYTGAWGISFALVVFNLGSAAYAHRIFYEGAKGLRKRSPEFTVALVLLMTSVFPFVGDFFGQQRQRLVRASLVQPYIPQGEKWDAAKAEEILQTIEKVTFDANDRGAPDAIFWPEAVTPWTMHRDPHVVDWLESVSHRTGKPLLLGSIFTEGNGPGEQWYNGAYVVSPVKGVVEPGYGKRKLVPFGEYVPLRPVLGWLEKVAPIGGDFDRGQSADPLQLPVGATTVPVGVL
ncbi:MAG TPA: apolipoprotein N-acyltransferase, partial [Candidatus Didemnitutus sp.]|nr:apolipoprotein N-acyltransferase [Candidatus Didemnitutus sp.]